MIEVVLLICILVLVIVDGRSTPQVVPFRVLEDIPKIELHAHLHGSLRTSTFAELAKGLSIENEKVVLDESDSGKLDRPFKLFPLVHQVVQSKQVLQRILLEMIEDYETQNTVYLEIRSTPRALADGTTIHEYIEALLDIVYEHNKLLDNKSSLLVKLIISVNRGNTLNDAQNTLELINASYRIWKGMNIIVGIDFSGNPLGGKFMDFVTVFERARNEYHFPVTVHASEAKELVEKQSNDPAEMDETEFILKFKPERLGHMLFIKQHHYDQLIEYLQSPPADSTKPTLPPLIEICPTTSLYLLGLSSYSNHPHIRKLLAIHYPISLNTDDSGIMSTNITKEIQHMQIGIELSLGDILSIQSTSLQYGFLSQTEREVVWKNFQQKLKDMINSEAYDPKLIQEDMISKMMADLSWVEYCQSQSEKENEGMDMSSLYTM